MSKYFIILSCILAISLLGNVSHALDNVAAKNYELSNSHEESMLNSNEDCANRKRGSMAFLILLKNSEENETSLEEKTEEAKKQINDGQKTKRCMALNLLRKSRLISVPKDAQKNDSLQSLNDRKSYFRLASRKDTNNILKSLLKSRSSQREDNDPIVSKSQDQDPIILVSQDANKSGNQSPKKYVCYCIEDNCVTDNPKQNSRSNAMRTSIGRNILAKSRYSTNEENQKISDLIAPQHQDLAAAHNLHCPPGAVLVEESKYSKCSDQKHHCHNRRLVKKCPPVIMPCESEAELIGQPMRISIPFSTNRKSNKRVYKVDRTSPFVQKLQSLIKQYDASDEVSCHEKFSPPNSVLGVQNYYSNNQKDFDRYAQVSIPRKLVRPGPYVIYPQYSQYPQYSDGLVGDSQIPLQPVDQPYEGHQEPSYEETALGRHFVDTEECIKMFGPSRCTVLTTPIPSENSPKTSKNYEEEHEDLIIGSQWKNEMHASTELPSRKKNKWNYSTNAHDYDEIGKTYLQEMEAGKTDKKYLISAVNSDESETEDYYDVTEETSEYEARKIPSIGSVSEFPQLAITSISSPKYLEYTIKPTGKDVNPSLSDDTSEAIAGYVSTPYSSSSNYGTAADQDSANIFHQEHHENAAEGTKYYTTKPGERAGIAKQHSIYGSLSYDEKRLESSAKSPNIVFMKMEEPRSNYKTTTSTESFKGDRFEDSQRIRTVYPVIDDQHHTLSASLTTQSSNNRIDESSVIPASNLYYSIEPEQTVANVAPIFATKMTPPQSPLRTIELKPVNNYSKSGFISSTTSRSDNQYPISHAVTKNVYDTPPLLGINNPGQREFTATSYPAQSNVEVKTISSMSDEIKDTNVEDNQGETSSTPHYSTRSEIADIDKYSSTQKNSHLQYIESRQLTNDERTPKKLYTQFFGSNEPTTENVISTKKYTGYLRKPVERPGNQYTTSSIKNLSSVNIESAKEHPLDKDLSRTVSNHYSRMPSKNWDLTPQSGKSITSFNDQEASTTDHGAQRQYVGSYQSFADGIVTTSRSNELNRLTSHLGTIHSSTATEGLQKSIQQPAKLPSEYDLSEQSERPLFIMNRGKSRQPEDLELGLPHADINYFSEDISNTYTTAESILRESTTAEAKTHKPEKNLNGKSRHPSKESHRLITTPSEYDNKEAKRPLGTNLSFENNSDMKEEFNGYFPSNTFDDNVEQFTGSDSYYEETSPKNDDDFNSTSSDVSTVTDNNETEDINSSTVIDERVGVANRPKASSASSVSNSKHYMRYHNGIAEESSPTETSNNKIITETQNYKEGDDFSPMTQTINENMPHVYPAKNYEEKYFATNYYETDSSQSKDDITRISKDEFENPSDSPYSSTPMSVTHYLRNPLAFSDIVESKILIHDESPTEDRSSDYFTNQYSQNTPETRIHDLVKDNDKSNAIVEQHKLTSQHLVSNTPPTMNTLKKDSSAVSKEKEKSITISNKLFGKINETQSLITYDKVGDAPSKANLNIKIENDVSSTQSKDCTESSAKAEQLFSTANEENTLRDVSQLSNHKITQPCDLVTEHYKFKEFTPSSDIIRALMPMVTTDDEAEATTTLTTKKINQQTPIKTTSETKNENAIEPIGTKNELLADKYMHTYDSSLEHSRATEYSPHPCEPTSSSPTVESTPSNRSFAVSEDLTLPTSKQVPSSTSKNKESVEKPLASDSTAPADKAGLLRLFSGGKSVGNSYKKYGAVNSINQITLEPHYTEYQTTPANECTEDILNDNGTSDEDRCYLTSAVQKVVQNLISPELNNPYKIPPNTPETVLTANQGLSTGSSVLKNLFSLPEVKDMVINTVKGLISERSGTLEDTLLDRLKDEEIESVLNGVLNNLLPGKDTTLSPSMTADKQKYKNGHWMVESVPLTSIEGNVVQKPADEILNSIKYIIERSEIGLQGAKLPAVQNIIVQAVENVLTKAKKVVDNSLIWETLKNIIARAENAENSSFQSLSTLGPSPKNPDNNIPSGSLKNMPIIPVIERVFKNGEWSEKQTVLGIRKKPFDSKLSPSTMSTSIDDSELLTSSSNHKTSMINADNLKVTTNAVDYALLGESEENEDQSEDVADVNGNVSIEKITDSVGATTSKQNIEHQTDPENAPIKYYSPHDRILTYIKNHQILEGKTDTTLHSSDTDEGTKDHCPSPDTQANEFSTTESSVEFEHATASDSDEVPVAIVETAESGESGELSTTETHLQKFTKTPKYYDSSQEAVTLTHGSFGAAKSRDKSEHLQEIMKSSSKFVTPKSDPTYFGKLSLNSGNPSEDRISDLANTDLFYIGDGVKIPLTIRRMPDGSYALSISEKICEKFINRKCPCCVPNEGDIVEESRQPNVADGVEFEVTSRRNSNDLASFEPTENPKYESESKRRYVRSTSGGDIVTTNISPVKSFVKKYNMTLNLVKDNIHQQSSSINEKEIGEVGNTRRNKRLGSFGDTKIMNLFDNDNQIRRDDSEERTPIIYDNSEDISKESNFIRRSEFSYDENTNSFIRNLLHIGDVPEHKRTEIVVNALDGLINSASAKNLVPRGHHRTIEFIDENSTEDQSQWEDSSVNDLQDVENKNAGYGYQKDNPILERIRFINENQHGHGQYKYQRNIDHHARGKMNILKTVLHWLREVFLEVKGNNKN